MTHYAYAKRVVEHFRKLYKRHPGIDFIEMQPMIELDNDYCLASVVWNFYNKQVIIMSDKVIVNDGVNRYVLITYNSFDELLSIK